MGTTQGCYVILWTNPLQNNSCSYLTDYQSKLNKRCWEVRRSKDELISDVFLWVLTYTETSFGWPVKTSTYQLCEDTGRQLDLPRAMAERDGWCVCVCVCVWERERERTLPSVQVDNDDGDERTLILSRITVGRIHDKILLFHFWFLCLMAYKLLWVCWCPSHSCRRTVVIISKP